MLNDASINIKTWVCVKFTIIISLALLFAPAVLEANPAGEGWNYCVKEKSTCSFSGKMEVAYGRDDKYRYQIHNNGVACQNTVFGDPIPGRLKECWYRKLSTSNYISIDVNDKQQKISLMGGDMERSAAFLMKASNSQQIADWYYKDIDFSYSRVSYDRQQELIEGLTNFAFYNDVVTAMKLVKNSRPNVKFWATLKSDYDGYGTTNNLPDWIYTGGGYNGGSYQPWNLRVNQYARFLSDYLKHMNDNGVPINVLSVSKEWTQVLNANREKLVINEIKRLLGTSEYSGVPIPDFSGPSTWGTRQATTFIGDALKVNSINNYSGISTHSYDNPSENDWKNLVEAANGQNLPVWHTESSSGSGGHLSGAEPLIDSPISAFLSRSQWYRQGLEGELFFENWSRGVDAETRAVYFTNGTAGKRLRAYYIMQHFANHAADGNYIGTTTTGLDQADTMVFRRGNKLILWIINDADYRHTDITVSLNGVTLSNSDVDRVAWYQGSSTSGYKVLDTGVNGTQYTAGAGPKALISYVFTLN